MFHRPATAHRDPSRTSFRRTHPVHQEHFFGESYQPYPKRLSCFALEDGPDNCKLNLYSPPPTKSPVVSPSLSIDSDGAFSPPFITESSKELPCTSLMANAMMNGSLYFDGHPTVFPKNNFDPIRDARKIRKAMKGNSVDGRSIISVLAKRSSEQRVAISETYVEMNGKEIETDLTKYGYGNFEVLVVLSLDSLPDTIAFALYEYIKGLDSDESIIIQGIVPYPNSLMRQVSESYKKQFNTDVVMDLFRHKRGDFRTILMALLKGMRDDSNVVDPMHASEDAHVLYKACEIPLNPNADAFTRILTQRSFEQIKEISRCYQNEYGTSLEKNIADCKFGGYKDTFIALVRYATDKDDLLAEWFNRSIQECAIDDWALMQLTLGRSEIDLQDIKEAYNRKYGKTLVSAIAGATCGEYKNFLMSMVGR